MTNRKFHVLILYLVLLANLYKPLNVSGQTVRLREVWSKSYGSDFHDYPLFSTLGEGDSILMVGNVNNPNTNNGTISDIRIYYIDSNSGIVLDSIEFPDTFRGSSVEERSEFVHIDGQEEILLSNNLAFTNVNGNWIPDNTFALPIAPVADRFFLYDDEIIFASKQSSDLFFWKINKTEIRNGPFEPFRIYGGSLQDYALDLIGWKDTTVFLGIAESPDGDIAYDPNPRDLDPNYWVFTTNSEGDILNQFLYPQTAYRPTQNELVEKIGQHIYVVVDTLGYLGSSGDWGSTRPKLLILDEGLSLVDSASMFEDLHEELGNYPVMRIRNIEMVDTLLITIGEYSKYGNGRVQPFVATFDDSYSRLSLRIFGGNPGTDVGGNQPNEQNMILFNSIRDGKFIYLFCSTNSRDGDVKDFFGQYTEEDFRNIWLSKQEIYLNYPPTNIFLGGLDSFDTLFANPINPGDFNFVLSGIDANNSPLSFDLVGGEGMEDNSSFSLTDSLLTNVDTLGYKTEYRIRIRGSDEDYRYEEIFKIKFEKILSSQRKEAKIVFPNPSNHRITILFEESPIPVAFKILSLTGQEIKAPSTRTKSKLIIDISGVRNGTYILHLNDQKFKVIKN